MIVCVCIKHLHVLKLYIYKINKGTTRAIVHNLQLFQKHFLRKKECKFKYCITGKCI